MKNLGRILLIVLLAAGICCNYAIAQTIAAVPSNPLGQEQSRLGSMDKLRGGDEKAFVPDSSQTETLVRMLCFGLFYQGTARR
jgi:hypothetical protein